MKKEYKRKIKSVLKKTSHRVRVGILFFLITIFALGQTIDPTNLKISASLEKANLMKQKELMIQQEMKLKQEKSNTLSGKILGVQTSIEAFQNRVEEMKEKSDWINNMKSVKQIIALLENIMCNSHGLKDSYVNVGVNNCFFEARLDVELAKVGSAVDMLIAIMSQLKMEQGDRVSILGQVIEILSSAITGLDGLNTELKAYEHQEKEKERILVAFEQNVFFSLKRNKQ